MKRKSCYSFITISLLLNCLISCNYSSRTSEEETSAPKTDVEVSATIKKADELFSQRSDKSKLRDAVNLLAQARNPDARNYEVEWKFAKYNYFLGDQTDDEKGSEKAFENGMQAGRIASRIAPDKPDGYFWYGANLGEQADRAPLTKGLLSVKDIRDAMNKTIEIQPDYENASAFDVLAQIELATRLTGGDAKKAIDYLEKAIKLKDDNSNLHLHLAEAYLADNRPADAKKQLEFVLKMKPNPDYLPEYEESQKDARKMLETKF
jgi:tetratricopeptide (TPR) repeat protein